MDKGDPSNSMSGSRKKINGEVHLKLCKSSDQLSDIFTKPLEKEVFEFHRRNLGVVSLAET